MVEHVSVTAKAELWMFFICLFFLNVILRDKATEYFCATITHALTNSLIVVSSTILQHDAAAFTS